MSTTITKEIEIDIDFDDEDFADAGWFQPPDEGDLATFLDALLAGDVDLARAFSDRVFFDVASRNVCQLKLTSALRKAA